MKTDVYLRDYAPIKIFPDAPYDVTLLIMDRSDSSSVTVHTHKAGLELIKRIVDDALQTFNDKQKNEEKRP